MVIDWWKSAPYGKPYLDYLDPQKWPSPWLLLEHGIYDQSSVSLGIYYTMLMADDQRWNSDRLRLCMLRNTQLCHENLTCIVDAKFLLGFEFGRITELKSVSDTTVLHSYNYDVDRRCVMEIKMTDFELQ